MGDTFTWSEVNQHSSPDDLYLVIHNKVYDVTKFQHEHPGGDEFLLDQAGSDVTELFEDAGHSEDARVILKSLQVGTMEEKSVAKETKRPIQGANGGLTEDRMMALPIVVLLLGAAFCAAIFIYPSLGLGPTEDDQGG